MLKLKKYLLVILFVIVVTFIPRSALCYEPDVHFSLTCILCCLAGFIPSEARIIADADESLDDNDTTSAFPKTLDGKIAHVRNPIPGYLWHSFADGNEVIGGEIINDEPIDTTKKHKAKDGKEAVERRMYILLKEASSSDDPKLKDKHTDGITLLGTDKYPIMTERKFRQLVKFGQYLHYYQDFYSHREPDYANLNADTSDNWEPYEKRFGHFRDGHNPDRIPWRLNLAKAMAAGCYTEISNYSKSVFKYHPIDLTTCVYDPVLTTGNDAITTNGTKFTDALIDAFASSYPPLVIPGKNKLAPNLPNEKPYVPAPSNEGKLIGNVTLLLLYTKANCFYDMQNDQPQYQFHDISRTMAGEYSGIYIMRETIPPINYDVNGNIDIKAIFLHNQDWFAAKEIKVYQME